MRCALFVSGDIPMRKRHPANSSADLAALRREITDLVARNAVGMVQHAIDAVRDDGHYQAIRFLFEMIGLYPAAVQRESAVQNSLAQLLLERLGLPSSVPHDGTLEKSKPTIP